MRTCLDSPGNFTEGLIPGLCPSMKYRTCLPLPNLLVSAPPQPTFSYVASSQRRIPDLPLPNGPQTYYIHLSRSRSRSLSRATASRTHLLTTFYSLNRSLIIQPTHYDPSQANLCFNSVQAKLITSTSLPSLYSPLCKHK